MVKIVHNTNIFRPPKFVSQLPQAVSQLREGAVLHLDAQVEPVGDSSLRMEWFHDDQPVRDTNRMKLIHDFGFVVLELCPAEPQDTGVWVCRATNSEGSAETRCQIEVIGDSGVSYEWVSPGERKERIAELDDWVNRPQATLGPSLLPMAYNCPPLISLAIFTIQIDSSGKSSSLDRNLHSFRIINLPKMGESLFKKGILAK